MTPHYADELLTLHLGDCVEVMAGMESDSVDAIVTDPPYDLTSIARTFQGKGGTLDPRGGIRSESRRMAGGFMGKAWDGTGIAFDPVTWREAFRVAKPGAHLLAFGGTRTVHRLASAIEDAGWEIRDCLVWAYASGFAKSRRLELDPRFCQCGAGNAGTARNGESTDDAQGEVGHTSTVEPSASQGERARSPNARRGLHRPEGSQDGYQLAHGFDGGPPLQGAVVDLAPPPLLDDVPARTRSLGPDDGHARPGPSHSRLSDGDSGHPSSQDSLPHDSGGAATSPSKPLSNIDGPLSGSASGQSSDRIPRTDSVLSAWPHCTICGNPVGKGYGSALKPAYEPIVMARKPLVGNLAANVLEHGTGALNIDGTRIPAEPYTYPTGPKGNVDPTSIQLGRIETPVESHPAGRWPANLILTDPIFDGGVEGVVGGGETSSGSRNGTHPGGGYMGDWPDVSAPIEGDTGTYSRFFLVPKAARSDREPVLGGSRKRVDARMGLSHGGPGEPGKGTKEGYEYHPAPRVNTHATVKPLELMRHLVRLVTPPGGTVLDCFLGSGTTAIAANQEGFRCIGIEREVEYLEIAVARLAHQPLGMGLDVAAPTRKRSGKERGNKDAEGNPTLGSRRSASDNWSGRWSGDGFVAEDMGTSWSRDPKRLGERS